MMTYGIGIDLGATNIKAVSVAEAGRVLDRPTDASDVIVSLNNSREPEPVGVTEVVTSSWDTDIEAAWSRRQRTKISGQAAAADAAKVLGVPRLSVSGYPSLDKLLAASEFLRSTWRRERNTIIKKS